MINPFSFISTNIKAKFSKKNEKDETKDEEEIVITRETKNSNEENTDKSVPQFIDELATVPVLTMDDFKSKYVEDNEIEDQSDSSDEIDVLDLEKGEIGISDDKAHIHQRRWKVAFWDLSIENLTEEEVNLFIEIDFGTSRDEFRVQSESKEYILSSGQLKHRIRTPIIHKLIKDKPQKIKFQPSFEYRGSYFDLEREKLKLSAWRYHNFRLNTLDAIYDTKLIECANSDLNYSCYLMKIVEGNKLEKTYKINFNLYFQEIYDFQLSLDHWEIKSLMSFGDIDKKLNLQKEKIIEKNSLNYSSIINFNFFGQNNDYISEINNDRKVPDLSCENSSFFGNLLFDKKFNKNVTQREKLFENVQITYKKESNKILNISDLETNIQSKLSLKPEEDQVDPKNCTSNQDNDQSIWKIFLKLLGINKNNEAVNIMNLDSLLLESELDQAKIHPSDCCPRLKIKLIWPSPIKEYTIFSSIQRGTNWPIWENIGSIFLRGTIADLENSFLDVEVIDTNKEKNINLQAKTHIPLKGLIETSTIIESKLSEPLWLVEKVKNTDKRRNFAAWEFGLMTGNISFINYPKQRQKGNFVNFIKDRVYLMIKILKVDNIITLENIEDFQIHASITHQGLTSRSTTMCGNGSGSILQDDYVVFPLQLPPISELYSFHLESLAEIYVDLWVSSKNTQYTKTEHAGYTSFTIWDTIYNIKGTKRPVSEKFYRCYASGTKEKLKVRVLEQEMLLKFLFPTDRVANITFEAFVTPDLLSIKPNNRQTLCSKNSGIPEKIDIFLRSRLDLSPSQTPKLYNSDKIAIQTTLTGKLGTGIIGRFFIFSVFNHRGNELMLSQFVNQMPSPNNITSPNAIFHFVRCVPFINSSFRDPPKRSKDKFNDTKNLASKRGGQEENSTFTFKKSYYWFTPDFTLLNNGGGVIDHCLLHVSLLLKVKIQAFVCIGTTNNGHFHAWVMSWHFNETENNTVVKFWELTTGQIYILRNRFYIQQRAREVAIRFRKRERLLPNDGDQKDVSGVSLKTIKLPYKSIDTIFNEMNIWYNIQNSNPGCIFFDLWNSNLFISCTNSPLVHQPGFRSQPYLSIPNKSSILNKKRLIKSVLNYEVEAHRTAQNLGTRWNRDPTLEIFLEKGLDLMEQSELSNDEEYKEICSKINNWKSALESKVPHMHRVLGFPLSFNHTNPKLISETILGKLEILFSRDKSFTVTISVVVYGYPNNTYCSRVFILVTQKISEREKKKILEQREKERIKNEEKINRKISVEKIVFIKKESETFTKSNSIEIKKELVVDSIKTQETPIEVEKNDDVDIHAASDSQMITKDYIGIIDKENKMIRKRRVTLPDGSVTGKLWISKKIKDDGNFRYYVDGIENSVSECLNIQKSRVCATDLNYEGQRVGFAILPGSGDDPTPIDLMYEMALKIDDLLKSDEKFIGFTGGDAVLEWDYDQDEYFDTQDENSNSNLEVNEDENHYEDNSINEDIESNDGVSSDDTPINENVLDEIPSESKDESASVSGLIDSGLNSFSSSEDEYLKRTIYRPDSNSDDSDGTGDKNEECPFSTSEKYEEQKIGCENTSININMSSKSNVNGEPTKELKRFTKTGKYIIYKRPEYEKSMLKKKQELNDYESNRDDNLVFPVASLAMSLARGHSEIRKNGLLTMGRIEAKVNSLKDKNLNSELKRNKDRAAGNSYSNDLFSKILSNKGSDN
ncbi:membrane protein [Cryptosporidium xiaoi]|uniref:Membrane protein n=1 Tax=Cryptosporidium xiaoi TaxID=659607 RepID=A0AAV9Y0Q7_9CRYT